LPAFAKERGRTSSPFVPDLARLEWALVEVLHAPAAQGFSPAELARIPEERLPEVRFQPSAAVRLLPLEYPVSAYLDAFRDGRRPDPVEHEASVVLVVRSGYRIRRRELKPCQATVLRRLLSSEPLGMAFSGVTADAEGVEAWFRDWSAWGVFSKVTVDPAPTGDTPPSPSTAR
jgi:hypothetical protein